MRIKQLVAHTMRGINLLMAWLRRWRWGWPAGLPCESNSSSQVPIHTPSAPSGHWVPTLETRLHQLDWLAMLRKADLVPGSLVEIQTTYSVYELLVLDQHEFLVSGGWFDKEALSPYHVRINGCTWGGSAIKHDIIAGAMMHIEFSLGDRTIVTTSHVRGWKVYRGSSSTAG